MPNWQKKWVETIVSCQNGTNKAFFGIYTFICLPLFRAAHEFSNVFVLRQVVEQALFGLLQPEKYL